MPASNLTVAPLTTISTTWGNAIADRVAASFTNAGDRSSKWPNPPKGAISFLQDGSDLWIYDGGWYPVGTTMWYGAKSRNTVQNHADGVPVDVQCPDKYTYPGGYRAMADTNFGVTTPVAGVYLAMAFLQWQPGVTARVKTSVAVNASPKLPDLRSLNATQQTLVTVSGPVVCAAGDLIGVQGTAYGAVCSTTYASFTAVGPLR